jgi:hypothetical protein
LIVGIAFALVGFYVNATDFSITIKSDALVESHKYDGKEKSSGSKRANSEE